MILAPRGHPFNCKHMNLRTQVRVGTLEVKATKQLVVVGDSLLLEKERSGQVSLKR